MAESRSKRVPLPPPSSQQPQGGQPPAAGTPPPVATAPPGAWAAPEPIEGPAPGIAWGGFGERLVGYIIDELILSVVITLITVIFTPFLLSGINYTDPENITFDASFFTSAFLLSLIVIVISLVYFPFFWTRGGQTPGMRVFGIRVVNDADGGPLTLGTAIVRLIGFWVSGLAFGLGYIWVFIDKRRRGWFDLIASTVVIKVPKAR